MFSTDEEMPMAPAQRVRIPDSASMITIVEIAIDRIDPSPFQRRRYFDADALRELANSLANDGFIAPVVVREKR